MSKLAGYRSNADLFIGAIIIWVENNVCPVGFSRVDLYDNSYIVAGSSVSTHGELAHEHVSVGHTHAPTATNTGEQNTTKAQGAGASVSVEDITHTFAPTSSGGTAAAVDSANSPGLAKVDVLLCQKD